MLSCLVTSSNNHIFRSTSYCCCLQTLNQSRSCYNLPSFVVAVILAAKMYLLHVLHSVLFSCHFDPRYLNWSLFSTSLCHRYTVHHSRLTSLLSSQFKLLSTFSIIDGDWNLSISSGNKNHLRADFWYPY